MNVVGRGEGGGGMFSVYLAGGVAGVPLGERIPLPQSSSWWPHHSTLIHKPEIK